MTPNFVHRRRFLSQAGGAAAALALSCPTLSMAADLNEVKAYKGIPYALPPIGDLRFKSPILQAFQGKPSLSSDFGAASIQWIAGSPRWLYPDPSSMSEDCLTLNIWAPANAKDAPVIVWIHGGAWRTGATSMPVMDGAKLAALGFVVVTVNYRLGALGGLAHRQFTDPQTGAFGNWGLQDQAAALQWVNHHIDQFGGDPGRVCLIGQSAGATNAILLAQHPQWGKLVHQVVAMSPAYIGSPDGLTLADAGRYAEIVALKLGRSVQNLKGLDAASIQAAELALSKNSSLLPLSSGKLLPTAPIIDGVTVMGDWTEANWPTNIPIIITNTLTEGDFFVDLYDPISDTMLANRLPKSQTELYLMAAVYLRSVTDAVSVVAAYKRAAMADGRPTDPASLFIEIVGDRLRQASVGYAQKLAARGANVRYGTFMHAIESPGYGVPHCADVPFLFGTQDLDYFAPKLGGGAVTTAVSAQLMTALSTFMRTGTPSFVNSRAWPRLCKDGSQSALLAPGNTSDVNVGVVPKLAQLAAWNGVL